ncbi:class I SAM-dependent methyltransferase [Streptomyces sulphureus]|uniref:class I SAM-dependent methyltransferase n=1 Tax=Streptomyces sulphureus TaxID=47758 RepID=UPI00035F9913|nr:class I SAM-dependent methyltransferase [Streptomyces sulphureus]
MDPFDRWERQVWAGSGAAYAAGLARLCAFPVPRLLAASGVSAGDAALDVGTGTGAAAGGLRARGASVVALDAEPDMAARAADALRQAPVLVGALPELPFRSGVFDAAVANFVVNHVARPGAALREMRRVVRTGGRFAATVWAAPPAAGQALVGRALDEAGAGERPRLAEREEFARTEEGLRELSYAAGFSDVRCTTLRWTHRTTHAEWWGAQAAGVGSTGHALRAQPRAVQEEAQHAFVRLSRRFAAHGGELALPHAAVLVSGRA